MSANKFKMNIQPVNTHKIPGVIRQGLPEEVVNKPNYHRQGRDIAVELLNNIEMRGSRPCYATCEIPFGGRGKKQRPRIVNAYRAGVTEASKTLGVPLKFMQRMTSEGYVCTIIRECDLG